MAAWKGCAQETRPRVQSTVSCAPEGPPKRDGNEDVNRHNKTNLSRRCPQEKTDAHQPQVPSPLPRRTRTSYKPAFRTLLHDRFSANPLPPDALLGPRPGLLT